MTVYKKTIPVFIIVLSVIAIVYFALDYVNTQASIETELLKKELTVIKAGKEALQDENENLLLQNKLLKEELENNLPVDKADIFEYKDLVEVRELDSTLEVELIYATPDNFTGQILYNLEVCLLRRDTAEKLAAANAEFARDGYRLKIWDAFRPRSAQEIMFKIESDEVYVADPAVGSNHNRGASVDVTLIDEDGNELEMPTGFDNFTEKASRNYSGMSEEAKKNMDYLTEVMIRHGFEPIRSEWWHFNDSEVRSYDLIDISLEEWVNAYFLSRFN